MTPCIEHPGSTTRRNRGYPKVKFGGKDRTVHRLAWEWQRGPIPPGMYVCHRCDNPRCYNIEHLFLGTPSDNARDMVAKGRGRQPHGEQHFRAKLTDVEVRAMRALATCGVPGDDMARAFGLASSTVNYVLRGKTWKHLLPKKEAPSAAA